MKIRNWVGIIIVLLSLAAMYLWESGWREKILYVPVTVASRDICKGEKLEQGSFKTILLPPYAASSDMINADEAIKLTGQYAYHNIHENQQLTRDSFVSEKNMVTPGYSYFVIPDSWIYSRSGALCEGDYIGIFSMENSEKIGRYKTAFVRSDGIEIICSLSDYFKIYDLIKNTGMASLLLVMEEI